MKRYALILTLVWASILLISEQKEISSNSMWDSFFPIAVFGAPLVTFFIIKFIKSKYKNKQSDFFITVNQYILYAYLAGIASIPIIIGMMIMNVTIYIAIIANVLLFLINFAIFKTKEEQT